MILDLHCDQTVIASPFSIFLFHWCSCALGGRYLFPYGTRCAHVFSPSGSELFFDRERSKSLRSRMAPRWTISGWLKFCKAYEAFFNSEFQDDFSVVIKSEMLRLVILCVTYLLRRNHFWALRSETSKRFVILWQRNQVLSHVKHFKASRRGHSHSCNLPGLVWLGAYSFAQPYVVRKSWARFNFDVYALPSIHCLYFIYARKMYVRRHAKITRLWKLSEGTRPSRYLPNPGKKVLFVVIYLWISNDELN